MLNVCRQWLVIALSIVLSFLALVLSGGGQLLAGITPVAMAATAGTDAAREGCTEQRQQPSFARTIVVDTHQIECGNLTTFGGNVAINGEVRGDVVAFNSSVVVAGTVDGNIQMYGGRVTLQSGSRIFGDIHLYGGEWVEQPNAQLHGSVIDHAERADWLFTGDGPFRFSLWSLLIWVVLGIVLTSLLPEHVMLVRTTVVSKMRRSLVIGLLSVLLAPAVIIVLIALVLSIPLAIIVGLGLLAAWALGTVAIGWLVGDYIMRRVAPQHNTRILQIVVGLTVLVLAGSLPYIGWLISIGVGLLGLGAVFLSRFGTRLYSQPKQPLTL
jgi:cytoskeletal protein CcmA (bactofilin family)